MVASHSSADALFLDIPLTIVYVGEDESSHVSVQKPRETVGLALAIESDPSASLGSASGDVSSPLDCSNPCVAYVRRLESVLS